MTPAQIDALSRTAGAWPEALEDIRHRFQARFADEDPSADEGLAWIQGALYDKAPHLFALEEVATTGAEKLGISDELYARLSPSEKLTRARQVEAEEQEPTNAREKRRPQYRTLTEQELADTAGGSWADQLTRRRELAQQPPAQPGR
jgi:hypothetical protein